MQVDPLPPLFLHQTEPQRAEKLILATAPPHSSLPKGLNDPPFPLSQGLDPLHT